MIIFKVRDTSPTQTTRLLDLSYEMRVKCGLSVPQTMPLSRQQGGAATVELETKAIRRFAKISGWLAYSVL